MAGKTFNQPNVHFKNKKKKNIETDRYAFGNIVTKYIATYSLTIWHTFIYTNIIIIIWTLYLTKY